MKAIVQDEYGEADDVLRLEQIDRPEIADDEVVVRVHAASVDRGVWHLMTGLPYPIRIAGYGLRAPKTRVRGVGLAGRVEAVGKAVTKLGPGDEVFGIGEGSFAEYARAREDKLAAKPEGLTFEQAAVVSVSALTALQGLRDHGGVQPGEKVLIIRPSRRRPRREVLSATGGGADRLLNAGHGLSQVAQPKETRIGEGWWWRTRRPSRGDEYRRRQRRTLLGTTSRKSMERTPFGSRSSLDESISTPLPGSGCRETPSIGRPHPRWAPQARRQARLASERLSVR